MLTKVFLSLSFVDVHFVRAVYDRLPRGVAYFYEQSFENGEVLLSAMERSIATTSVFVLFASKQSLQSKAVLFELDEARTATVFGKGIKLLIFPTDSEVTYKDLPVWLQQRWLVKAGWSPSDIARYITTILLSPSNGLITQMQVRGRGGTSDRLDGIVARHLQKTKSMPVIYTLTGLPGIGRRTFANYYMTRSMASLPYLPFGPSFPLPIQADAADLYRALRSEITVASQREIEDDYNAFQTASDDDRNSELLRMLGHFWSLQQSVTIITSSGLFEDRGEPKAWVSRLLGSLPQEAIIFLVTNRHFNDDALTALGNAVQMRVDELSNDNIQTLMIHAANNMGIENFKISQPILSAIGGHPDVANAAVRLAAAKGLGILEKDPAQLMNIQYTILGETIDSSVLSADEKIILDILSWVPGLSAELLEETATAAAGFDEQRFNTATQSLLLSCLITVNGFIWAISPAIQQLYRRRNPTPKAVTDALGVVMAKAWSKIEGGGAFREDVFEASIFVQTMQGLPLPDNLKNLISPGFLSDLVRQNYARAKNSDDENDLKKVISLGTLAKDMRMSEAVREEILSTTTRAMIRAGDFESADDLIDFMIKKGYRSVTFLCGHKLRKQRQYPEAIKYLREALIESKHNRAVINELALSYMNNGDVRGLRDLFAEVGAKTIHDSAILTDFQIGLDLGHNRLPEVRAGIARLRSMTDDDGRSDRRSAQLLMKDQRYKEAKELLSKLLDQQSASKFLIRSLRAQAAAWDGDYKMSQRDIEAVQSMPGRRGVAARLEIELLVAQGLVDRAEELLGALTAFSPQDILLKAKLLEVKAELPTTGMAQAQRLKDQALELRVQVSRRQDRYEE
jgi:tetratricopeptide (TPR) repeat protein